MKTAVGAQWLIAVSGTGMICRPCGGERQETHAFQAASICGGKLFTPQCTLQASKLHCPNISSFSKSILTPYCAIRPLGRPDWMPMSRLPARSMRFPLLRLSPSSLHRQHSTFTWIAKTSLPSSELRAKACSQALFDQPSCTILHALYR